MTRWWPLPTLVVAKLDHVPDDPFFVVPTTHYYYFWNLNGDSLLCHSLLVDRIHPCFVNSIGQSSPRSSSSSFLVGSKISDREDPCMVHDSTTMGDGEEVVISIGRPDFVAAAAAWCGGGHYDGRRHHWSSSDPPVVPCATGVPLSKMTTTVAIDVVRCVVSVSWLYWNCDQSS